MMRGTYGRSWALLCVLGTLVALSGCTRWWREAIAEGFRDATYRPKPSDPVKLDKFLLSEQGSLFICGDVIRAGEGAGTRTFVVYFPLPRSDATVDLDAPRPVPEIGFGKGNYGHCSLGHKRHRKLFPEDTGWRVVRPRPGGTRLSLEAFERGEIPAPADGDVAIYPIEVPEGRRYLFYGPAVPGGPRLAILLKTEGRFLRRLWPSN